MDFSGIGDILGSVAGLGSGVLGYLGQQDALDLSKNVAKSTAAQNQQMIDAMLAPFRDARGNVVAYVPKNPKDPTQPYGWTTELAPASKALVNATDAESFKQLTSDLPMMRSGMVTNYKRRADESAAADALLNEFENGPRYTREGVHADLQNQAVSNVNAGYDRTINDILRQYTRAGIPSDELMSKMGQERARDVSSAMTTADVEAPKAYEGLEASRASRLLDPYNMLAARASNVDDVAFNPSTISEGLSQIAAGNQRSAPYAGANLSSGTANAYNNVISGLGNQGKPLWDIGIGLQNMLGGLDDIFKNRSQGSTGYKIGGGNAAFNH